MKRTESYRQWKSQHFKRVKDAFENFSLLSDVSQASWISVIYNSIASSRFWNPERSRRCPIISNDFEWVELEFVLSASDDRVDKVNLSVNRDRFMNFAWTFFAECAELVMKLVSSIHGLLGKEPSFSQLRLDSSDRLTPVLSMVHLSKAYTRSSPRILSWVVECLYNESAGSSLATLLT